MWLSDTYLSQNMFSKKWTTHYRNECVNWVINTDLCVSRLWRRLLSFNITSWLAIHCLFIHFWYTRLVFCMRWMSLMRFSSSDISMTFLNLRFSYSASSMTTSNFHCILNELKLKSQPQLHYEKIKLWLADIYMKKYIVSLLSKNHCYDQWLTLQQHLERRNKKKYKKSQSNHILISVIDSVAYVKILTETVTVHKILERIRMSFRSMLMIWMILNRKMMTMNLSCSMKRSWNLWENILIQKTNISSWTIQFSIFSHIRLHVWWYW